MRARWMVACGAALAAIGCGSSMYGNGSSAPPCTLASATPVTSTIELAGMAFVPSCAKLTSGTAVTFTNDDATPHTVTTDAGQVETFDSGSMAQGAHFAHTFATVGTVMIHCTFHANMHLTVFVQ